MRSISRNQGGGRRLCAALCAIAATAGSLLLAAPGFAAAGGTLVAQMRAHPWRHGIELLRPGRYHRGFNTAPHATATTGSAAGSLLAFEGGPVGVVTGAPKVYLVFWGSQWGAQSTSPAGYTTLAGDPDAVAPDLQAFFKGLGTDGELWSGVMTQHCQGVATGTTSCPSTAPHAGYPAGGALGGVWVDESASAPADATSTQLGTEALAAAAHFGQASTAASIHSQYFIVSPTGTHPDGFNAGGGFCAWHSSAYASGEQVAYTNMPYVPDDSGCGEDFVNSGAAGTDDGVTIVGGHEYAETLTDEFPDQGWLDSAGEEAADKCAWIRTGQGASQDITLATGSFPVQSIWANDFDNGTGGCETSHPIISTGATVTVTNPGSQSGTVGTMISPLPVQASDSAAGQTLSYTASGLPAGLSISSGGKISGTPTTAGTSTVKVTATDSTGATGSTTFTWTVKSSGGSGSGCTAAQLLGNPGFETGTAAPWTATAGVINDTGQPAHSGRWNAWLDGYGVPHTDTLAQTVSIPAGCTSDSLSFWLHIDTANTSGAAQDSLKVQLLNASGTVLTTLASYSNLNANSGYAQKTFNVGAYAGQTIALELTGVETGNGETSFVVDDFALNVAAGSAGGANTVTVTSPGSQSGTVGTAITALQVQASDSASGQTLSYAATGLPAGLSISTGGKITGTPTTAGTSTVTVTATDTTGVSASTTFTWKIASGSTGTLVSGGVYEIGRVGTGQVIDNPASSTTAATQLIVYTLNGGSNQKWTATANADGSYTFKNGASGMCMDDSASSTAAGNPIIQWPCTGNQNQDWRLTASGTGYELVNEVSGLAVTPNGTADLSKLTQQAGSQAWTFTKVG